MNANKSLLKFFFCCLILLFLPYIQSYGTSLKPFFTSYIIENIPTNTNYITSFGDSAFTGISIGEYDDGTRKYEFNFKNGLPDGRWTVWHQNGNIEFMGNFVKGARNGLFVSNYSNGKTRFTTGYMYGKFHGKQIAYYENGKKSAERNYENGNRIGKYKWWSEDGKTILLGNVKNGTDKRRTYENNKLITESVIEILPNGEEQVSETHYNTKGEKVSTKQFLSKAPHGIWKTYDSNGKVTNITTYNYGIKHGKEIDYFKNTNQPKTITLFQDGNEVEVTNFYVDGTKRSFYKFKGELELQRMEYYEDGTEKIIEQFNDENQLHGKQVFRDLSEDGELRIYSSAEYINGKLHGRLLKKLMEDNSIISAIYSKGELVSQSKTTLSNQLLKNQQVYEQNGIKKRKTTEYFPNGTVKKQTIDIPTTNCKLLEIEYNKSGEAAGEIRYFQCLPVKSISKNKEGITVIKR